MSEIKNNIKEIAKTKVLFYLLIISFISLCLKFYFVDFSIPVNSDNLDYLLMGISYVNGDFSQSVHRGAGWPLFVSFFYQFIENGNLLDYSNTIRILGISISTLTIPLMYLVSRKFFDHRYALLSAGLLAFEPHLNYNSTFGLSESIFLVTVLFSFYFLLNKNSKFIIPSLLIAGFAWWIKLDGFFIFLIISVTYLIMFRKKKNWIRNFIFGIIVFSLIVSPILIQKNEQFGDPFYSYYNDKMFAGSYEDLASENTGYSNASASAYIEKNGVFSFIENFILKGLYNIFQLLIRISFPYLMILIPFGIFFSFRAFDQDNQYVKTNWIFLLLAMGSMIITLSIIAERRYLFYLLPYFIIFSIIPIQRVTEYGLNTFSFTRKQKDIFLIIVTSIALCLSIYFIVYHYESNDTEFENEKLFLSEFIIQNLDGKLMRDFGPSTEYINYKLIIAEPEKFKEFTNSKGLEYIINENVSKVDFTFISGESVKDVIEKGKEFELKYIVVYKNNNVFHEFFSDVYLNEEKYPFLIKIFDSNDHNFTKIEVKIFEINYNKFNDTQK